MLLAMLALLMSPPLPFYPTPAMDSCEQVVCPFTPQGSRVCYCAPAVLTLGVWDVRPAPKEWPDNADVAPPKAWGEYPTEKRD